MGNVMSNPKVSLSIVAADAVASNAAQRVLLVGVKNATGTATAGALITNIPNDGSEKTLFGLSNLSEMVQTFKEIAPEVWLDIIPLAEESGGTAAEYQITISGTATEDGYLDMYVGSYKRNRKRIAITSGMTAAVVGIAVGTAYATLNDSFFTVSPNGAGLITLTAYAKGTMGNSAVMGCIPNGAAAGMIAGLTVSIAQTSTGATDPTALSTTALFSVLNDNRYQGIVWPFPDTIATPSGWLDSKFNVNNAVRDGVVFVQKVTSYGTAVSTLAALNSKSLVMFIEKTITVTGQYKGPAGREMPHRVAAAFAAMRALRLTKGAAVSQYLTTKASADQFGGPALASLPYMNSTIPILSIPFPSQGFIGTEISSIEDSGGSIIGQNVNKTDVLVGTVSTTYKTDPAGNADISWKYLNYVDTMSNIREYFFNNYKKRFAQSRLTEGALEPGRDMVNKALFEAYTDRLYGDLTGADFVLCQAGELALKFFKKNRSVTLDLATGTITVDMLVPIVTQVRNIIGTIKIAFSTEG